MGASRSTRAARPGTPPLRASRGGAPKLWPDTETTTEREDLADVIGVVIGDQQELAQPGLTGAVRNGREEIDFPVRRQPLQRLAIAPVARDRGGPRRRVARPRRLRPVVVRPF